MTRPRLVIVAGAPATGKTTLARELARRLHLAIFTKDDIKEALADALGPGDQQRSRELGRAAYAVLFDVARQTLSAGTGVVVEANFYHDESEPRLRSLVAMADGVVVLCRSDPAVRRERFASRRDRHPVHLDAEILWHEWPIDDTRFAIDVGVPTLVVDTTRTYDPDVEHIAQWVSEVTISR